jgi:hypothetical protein
LAESPSEVKWYHHPVVVLVLLFLVLGPFGLPLLYQSPSFDRVWKAVLTVAVLLYTLWLIIVTFQQASLYSNKLLGI